MKVNYTSLNERFELEIEAADVKSVFEQVAAFEEIFGNNNTCKCGNENTRPSVREIDSNKYYEFRCDKCHKTFAFGQHKKGSTLFPKWERGWEKYDPKNEENEPKKGKK